MKKTVLFLINGFGMEQQGSYNIYNKQLMPNLEKYTQEYLFSPIETTAFDTEEGYRLFSTFSNLPLTYSLIDQMQFKFDSNPNLNSYIETIGVNSTIHLFCPLENDKTYEQLRNFLKFIASKKHNPIVLHIFLTSKDNKTLNETERLITKINYEMQNYKVGSVVGNGVLTSNGMEEYMALLHNKVGEKWKEFGKKFNSLIVSGIPPYQTKGFFIDDEFEIKQNDSIFFMNYEYGDYTNFANAFQKIYGIQDYYSLFPVKGMNFPMFAYPISGMSMQKNLETIDANACIVASKEEMRLINYYCTGLKNEIPKNIFYTLDDIMEDVPALNSLLQDEHFQLVIINHTIDNCKNVNEIIEKLKVVDRSLGMVHDLCVRQKHTLLVSSLFGIKKELIKDNFTRCQINFSGRVPFIVVDEVYKKGQCHLDYGNIPRLANTCYKSINLKYNGDVIIKQNSPLSKLLKKKKVDETEK